MFNVAGVCLRIKRKNENRAPAFLLYSGYYFKLSPTNHRLFVVFSSCHGKPAGQSLSGFKMVIDAYEYDDLWAVFKNFNTF